MQLASSFSGENALPANVLIPSNLVDHARAKRPPPPSDSSLPVLRRCDAAVPVHLSPVQTWVETLERRDSKQLGLVDLHPDVFAVPTRGPTSFYYMLPMKVRVQGIKIALSSKLTQDCLHVVDTLNIPTPDPQYLMDLIRYRHWGESVLIVDVGEELPENILQVTESLKTVNVLPAIGLNIHSMLKHEVLVLTLEAVKFLENKLLWHDERFTPLYPFKLPYTDLP
ncbi:39S ribosomal protein L4, mitochondrial isoform X2 [Salmo trutta]|nr:39S ribosomal protein L4, mitochondrial-like isoform X2 [Salmo trutta]